MSGVSTAEIRTSWARRAPLRLPAGLRAHLLPLVLGIAAVALFVDWAAQDGGYDPTTWYWGALLTAGTLAALLLAPPHRRARIGRPTAIALGAFAVYVGWSYLSITWASSPGDALQGSNRALLYLLVFAVMAVVPWTPRAALAALTTFALAIGALAAVLLARLAAHDGLEAIFTNGRLQAPTGYFNASVALFMVGALVSVGLASQRRLSAPLRGLLLGMAAAELQLAVTGGSRGWLFTLPLVVLGAIVVVRDRIRFVLAAALPAAATVAVTHRLVAVYDDSGTSAFTHAATRAGEAGLVACAALVAVGTVLAAIDTLTRPSARVARAKPVVGAFLAIAVIAAGVTGGFVATHGHPVSFIKRQWDGFSHPQVGRQAGSRFDVVGSGRYDFWRVAVDGFEAHPVLGLGQDNFADFYIRRRRTTEEPAWTHSLEIRLLAMNGLVGTLSFVVFVAAAGWAAARRRRARPAPSGWIAGVALLPLCVWLIHGSIDWFWEMPCLSGPALGLLAMAGTLGSDDLNAEGASAGAPHGPRTRWALPLRIAGVGTALAAVTVALGLPYLSVVEQARASRERVRNPVAALADLSTASSLNPLSAVPARLAGSVALQNGQYEVALRRFHEAVQREPGGWFGWLGEGLAASVLGETVAARHDFRMARSINGQQPAVLAALDRVGSTHPLTPEQALQMLIIVQ